MGISKGKKETRIGRVVERYISKDMDKTAERQEKKEEISNS